MIHFTLILLLWNLECWFLFFCRTHMKTCEFLFSYNKRASDLQAVCVVRHSSSTAFSSMLLTANELPTFNSNSIYCLLYRNLHLSNCISFHFWDCRLKLIITLFKLLKISIFMVHIFSIINHQQFNWNM